MMRSTRFLDDLLMRKVIGDEFGKGSPEYKEMDDQLKEEAEIGLTFLIHEALANGDFRTLIMLDEMGQETRLSICQRNNPRLERYHAKACIKVPGTPKEKERERMNLFKFWTWIWLRWRYRWGTGWLQRRRDAEYEKWRKAQDAEIVRQAKESSRRK